MSSFSLHLPSTTFSDNAEASLLPKDQNCLKTCPSSLKSMLLPRLQVNVNFLKVMNILIRGIQVL
jgi:hypothetical protein